ncbi:MAG: thioredoxin family protein [Nitrospirae bacterium]|nr:thioredoxin family protein [Nitrospirota bacterium]
MKKILVITIIILVAASLHAFAFNGIKWHSLSEGMERAKTEKKPMIVDFFYGKGCQRCEFLQTQVYDDLSIAAKIMNDFIPIRIDLAGKLTKEEEKLGNQYDYKNDCLLLFLDHNGNLVRQPGGKNLCFVDRIEPEWFIKYLDMVKEGYVKNK